MSKIDFPTAVIMARLDALEDIIIKHGGEEARSELGRLFKDRIIESLKGSNVLPAGERVENESSSN
jgi:hypothetical protein